MTMSLLLSWIRRPGPPREDAAATIRAFVSTLSRLDGGRRPRPEVTP
jgi:hypothetical protein